MDVEDVSGFAAMESAIINILMYVLRPAHQSVSQWRDESDSHAVCIIISFWKTLLTCPPNWLYKVMLTQH